MGFKNFYFESQTINEILGSYVYTIPEDFQETVWDFYATSMIYEDKIDDDELAHVAKDTKFKIASYMYEVCKEATYRAVADEIINFRPIVLRMSGEDKEKETKIFSREIYDVVSISLREWYDTRYWVNSSESVINTYKKITDIIDRDWGKRTEEPDGQEIYTTFKEKISPRELFEFGIEIFLDEDEWEHKFGGKKWDLIAKAGLKVWDITPTKNNITEVYGICDHVFDIEHNTDSIFSKWPGKVNTKDLKKILDKKKYIDEPLDFYEHISYELKRFYAAAVKNLYGQDVEGYQRKFEKPTDTKTPDEFEEI